MVIFPRTPSTFSLNTGSLFPPGKRREGMKRIGAAYFASCWWPYASMDKLRVAAFLAIWVSICSVIA